MTENPSATAPANTVDRRKVLAGSTAAVVAMTISGASILHTSEAWGLETKALTAEAMRTIIKMARDIFPHDQVADRFYATACKVYDEKSATDPKMKAMVEAGLARLDAMAKQMYKLPYDQIGWETQRVAVLKKIADGALFKKLRGDLVVSLYNQKEVWPLFGYEGESASKGGYLARGFDDIKWL